MRTIELETILYSLGFLTNKDELKDKIAKEQNYHHAFIEKRKTKKTKVPQAIICELLNLNTEYVTIAIYNSRKLIMDTYDKVCQSNYRPDSTKKAPKEFYPFKEFNITLIKRPRVEHLH